MAGTLIAVASNMTKIIEKYITFSNKIVIFKCKYFRNWCCQMSTMCIVYTNYCCVHAKLVMFEIPLSCGLIENKRLGFSFN